MRILTMLISLLIIGDLPGLSYTLEDIQKETIKYSSVDVDDLVKWRRNSKYRFLIPAFKAEVSKDMGRDLKVSSSDSTLSASIGNDNSFGLSFSASWDLGKIIYDNDMLRLTQEMQDIIKAKNDILKEVTELYFKMEKSKKEQNDDDIAQYTARINILCNGCIK